MKPTRLTRTGALLLISSLLVTGCATLPGGDAAGAGETGLSTTSGSAYGPAHTTFERNGIRYTKGTVAFPTGVLSSSSLLLEKVVPAEAIVGTTYQVSYTLRNLSDVILRDVVLTDVVGQNFGIDDSAPSADLINGDTAIWNLGEMPPGSTRNVILKASSPSEGLATSCSSVTFIPAHCETIRIVRADLELSLELPGEVTLCDEIQGRIKVRNTGSGRLTDVIVTDDLPDGLTAEESASQIRIEAGHLNPGESREFNLSLKAVRGGRYELNPTANSVQEITAEDRAEVVVGEPRLLVTSNAPSERFVGRPIPVCFQLENAGDTVSANTILTVPVPAGAIFRDATGGGVLSGNAVVWNFGSVPANSQAEVCATFTGNAVGTLTFVSQVEGACSPSASAVSITEVTGISAILLEVIDLEDPIEVGSNQTYQIVVTNQGSAPATNVRVTAQLEDEQAYISSSGTTPARVSGQTIRMNRVRSIAPGESASWQVVVKALEKGDIRFSVQLESDQVGRPVRETEATNQY